MEQVHLGIAVVAVVLGAGIALLSVAGLLSGRQFRREIDRLILVELAVLAIAIADGVLLLVTGHRPTDPLHLLYALVVLAILPLARFGLPAARPATRSWLLVGGGVVLLGLLLRLWQTGGG